MTLDNIEIFATECSLGRPTSRDKEIMLFSLCRESHVIQVNCGRPTTQLIKMYSEERQPESKSISSQSELNRHPPYYCEVCLCDTSGPKAFESHLDGARHKKNLRHKAEGRPLTKGRSSKGNPLQLMSGKTDKSQALIMSVLKQSSEALIGLNSVIEYQKLDSSLEPHYVCTLCQSVCDPRTILTHVTGLKHKLNYMKEHYPSYYTEIMDKCEKRSSQTILANEYAHVIECEEGRQQVKVAYTDSLAGPLPALIDNTSKRRKKHLPDKCKDKRICHGLEQSDVSHNTGISFINDEWTCHRSRISDNEKSSCQNSTSDGNQMESKQSSSHVESQSQLKSVDPSTASQQYTTASQHPVSGQHSAGVVKFLEEMANCVVTSERDAEIALQVSNTLTKALLNYRMKDLSKKFQL